MQSWLSFCSFLVGCIQLGAGILRAGYVVSFVGHPVVSRFTSGSALIIGILQVKDKVGYNIQRGHIYETLYNLFKNIGNLQCMPSILGTLWTLTLISFKQGLNCWSSNKFFKIMKPIGVILMCAIGIRMMHAFPVLKTEQFIVKVVGPINVNLEDIFSGTILEFESASILIVLPSPSH